MGLFNSTVLDVAIGLVFVYLLLSIICTAANEWLAALTKQRAKFLKKSLLQLLDNQPTNKDGSPGAFIKEFYQHPLITGMMRDGSHPTYLSARTFSAVISDLLAAGQSGDAASKDLGAAAAAIPEGDVKKALVGLAQHSQRDLSTTEEAIEAWFNDAMDRVSGWYKRRTQTWTMIVAIVITVIANADTIGISRRLWTDPVLRSAAVEEAKVRAQKPRPRITVEYKDEDDPTNPTVTTNEGNQLSDQERAQLGQLLGWRNLSANTLLNWLERLFGWMLTILALSLGAPFWFDLLNKFINIRSAGKSPDEKSKKPEKEDADAKDKV